MISKSSRIVILFSFLVLLMIALIPNIPWWIKIPIITVLGFLSILAVIVIGIYYSSLPDSKKSILSYLVVFCMWLSILAIAWFWISTVAMEIPALMMLAIESDALLICSVLSYEISLYPVTLCFSAIIVFKIMLIRDSLAFHQLDHEFRFKQTVALILIISVSEIFLKQWLKPCASMKRGRIEVYSQMEIEIPESGKI